eukprot:1799712-Pleurochrysis_carterae.AAC.5
MQRQRYAGHGSLRCYAVISDARRRALFENMASVLRFIRNGTYVLASDFDVLEVFIFLKYLADTETALTGSIWMIIVGHNSRQCLSLWRAQCPRFRRTSALRMEVAILQQLLNESVFR